MIIYLILDIMAILAVAASRKVVECANKVVGAHQVLGGSVENIE